MVQSPIDLPLSSSVYVKAALICEDSKCDLINYNSHVTVARTDLQLNYL